MTAYRIRNWAVHFENSESRKVKGARWLPVPNKHDGKGYRRVAQHPDSVQLFCAWSLILQVASKMPERGLLADEDGALDADDLSAMTGFPAAIFELAFKVLLEKKIGWIEQTGILERPEISGRVGVELKGTELKGTELKDSPNGAACAAASAMDESVGEDDEAVLAREAQPQKPSSGAMPQAVTGEMRVIWDLGVTMLRDAGMTNKEARSLIGGLAKDYGKQALAAAIAVTSAANPADPRAYLIKTLQPKDDFNGRSQGKVGTRTAALATQDYTVFPEHR